MENFINKYGVHLTQENINKYLVDCAGLPSDYYILEELCNEAKVAVIGYATGLEFNK